VYCILLCGRISVERDVENVEIVFAMYGNVIFFFGNNAMYEASASTSQTKKDTVLITPKHNHGKGDVEATFKTGYIFIQRPTPVPTLFKYLRYVPCSIRICNQMTYISYK
jgi:hypothetical protein